jgi:hypothetical protein
MAEGLGNSLEKAPELDLGHPLLEDCLLPCDKPAFPISPAFRMSPISKDDLTARVRRMISDASTNRALRKKRGKAEDSP